MSVNLTINGQTFAYPEVGDTDWGTSATLWATAATNGMLQKAGGTFTLLADVNFGATFGIVSAYYKSTTTNISTAGSVRLAQADSIGWRNNANSGNLLLSVSSDALQFNGTSIPLSGLIVNADISPSAAIAYSKLNLATSIVNADISASAAIAYSKLNLASSIVNADISGSAAIAYSKLNLATSIVNADINASAAIAGTKISPAFGNQVVSGDREFQFTEIATPGSPPASSKVFLYPKSDGNFYKMDDSGVEVAVGSGGSSGGGSLNIVDNPSAVSATTGWTAAANYTVSRDTSNSPLAGVIDSCFAISTTLATTESSTSGVYAASLANPSALRNTKLQLSMYVTVPASSLGVWTVSVYNSGGTRVALSTDSSSVTTLPAGYTGQFAATFDADSGATYTLSITQPTRSSANTLYVTNISIGNDQILQGSVVGRWTTYTPASTQGFGTISGASFEYRRVGDSAEIRAKFTTGTLAASEVQISLPSGLTVSMDTAAGNKQVGRWLWGTAAASILKSGPILASNGNSYLQMGFDGQADAQQPYTVRGGTFTGAASSLAFGFNATVGIAEWAGSGTVNLASNGVEYAASTTGTWNADAAAVNTIYGPSGAPITGNLTAERIKIVKLVASNQVTQAVDVELFFNGRWVSASATYPYQIQNTASYGVRIIGTSGDPTSVTIVFGRYLLNTGATYGAAGAEWGALSNASWRVVLASSGQAVGFGVVSENASGLMPSNNSVLDNASATRLGLKSYSHGTTYNGGIAPTITLDSGGGTLTSVNYSSFIPYQMQDGGWRLKFNAGVTLSSAVRTQATIRVNGVTSIASFYQSVSGSSEVTAATLQYAMFEGGSGDIICGHASATTSIYNYSGDVALSSKPTWAY